MKTDKSIYGKVIAGAILGGYIVLIFVMWATVDEEEEKSWERYIFLFKGAEAVAFAAAGWIFGKDVNRERAENAEKDADKSKKEVIKKENQLKKAEDMFKELLTHVEINDKLSTYLSPAILFDSVKMGLDDEVKDSVSDNVNKRINQSFTTAREKFKAFADEIDRRNVVE
jgi:hypothetical protein